jgi:Na+/proline symporter
MIKRFCALGWVFTGVTLATMAAQHRVSADQIHHLSEKRELAFGIAMQTFLPVGMIGLMFAAILSAQMATLSAHMVNSSALASRNIFKDVIRPAATDHQVLWFGRMCGLLLVSIGVLLAFRLDKVATALTMLLSFHSIMGVVVWAGVLWRRSNAKGAWACFLVMFLVWAVLGPIGMIVNHPAADGSQWLPHWIGLYGSEKQLYRLMVWALPAGIAALVVVSLMTPSLPKKQIDDFFMLLRTPVGQEQKLVDAGVPMVYSGNHTANYLETHYPNWVHWGGAALAGVICMGVLGLLFLLAAIGR